MNKIREEILKMALGPAELTTESGQQSFRLDEGFIGFAGHFPNYPILPAVLQILMAQLLAEQLIGEPLQFLSIERAKFINPVRPGDRIDLSLNCREEKDGHLLCSSLLRVGEYEAARFSLLLGKGCRQ